MVSSSPSNLEYGDLLEKIRHMLAGTMQQCVMEWPVWVAQVLKALVSVSIGI